MFTYRSIFSPFFWIPIRYRLTAMFLSLAVICILPYLQAADPLSLIVENWRGFLLRVGGVAGCGLGIFLVWTRGGTHILDPIAEKMRQLFMGETSSYNPDKDELLQLVAYTRESSDREMIPRFEALCEQEPRRMLNWQEYAKVMSPVFFDHAAAAEMLARASTQVPGKKDRALMPARSPTQAEADR